jgi:hypothetical protein
MQPSEDTDSEKDLFPPSRAAPLLASCFWCERLHRGEHPLSVCPLCVARFSTMRSLEMSGPHPLDDAAIDAALTRTAPGNYALGYMDDDTFQVFFVGRSDSDVRGRLHEWVGRPSRPANHAGAARAAWGSRRRGPLPIDVPALRRVTSGEGSYTRFAFSYARCADEAYAKEWRNYDTFGGRHGLDNETPPFPAGGRPPAAAALGRRWRSVEAR